MTSPGPHAFLLVLSLTRFTQEEEESINHFVEYFGDEVYDYMVALFTRKDDLDHDGITLDDHVRKVPQPLKDILRRCGGRKLAFNNRATGSDRDSQVRELLDIVEDIKRKNRGRYYTNDMYGEAEKVMRHREAEIRRKRKDEKKRERKKIEREVEDKYKREFSRHKKEEEDLHTRIAELESERDFHDSSAQKTDDEIQKLKRRIADQKKYGKVDPALLRKLKDLEDELHDLRSKGSDTKVQKDLKSLRDELTRVKKRAKKAEKEKERQMEERLKEQERKFAEMQQPREVARNEVETGKGSTGDQLIGGIMKIGKLIWKGITSLGLF